MREEGIARGRGGERGSEKKFVTISRIAFWKVSKALKTR
jgi:hypothetical protein